MNSFEKFEERAAIGAAKFVFLYLLPALAVFCLWFYWSDLVRWLGPSLAFRT